MKEISWSDFETIDFGPETGIKQIVHRSGTCMGPGWAKLSFLLQL